MDLFEAYPGFAESESVALRGRSIRLISLSGIVYDADHFYFELSAPRSWGHLSDGTAAIGVGTPKIQPNRTDPPHLGLIRDIRRRWRMPTDLLPVGHTYVLDESEQIHVLERTPVNLPYLLVLTPPRLGGGEMPDALAQAAYLLPSRGAHRGVKAATDVAVLGVSRDALQTFLEPESWLLREVRTAPWALVGSDLPLPDDATVRPVLALRGLQQLVREHALPGLPGS